jgi:hypothetical protein
MQASMQLHAIPQDCDNQGFIGEKALNEWEKQRRNAEHRGSRTPA